MFADSLTQPPSSITLEKPKEEFRNYVAASETVKKFYEDQHKYQTLKFVLHKKEETSKRIKSRVLCLGVWEAMERLETIVDDSDP